MVWSGDYLAIAILAPIVWLYPKKPSRDIELQRVIEEARTLREEARQEARDTRRSIDEIKNSVDDILQLAATALPFRFANRADTLQQYQYAPIPPQHSLPVTTLSGSGFVLEYTTETEKEEAERRRRVLRLRDQG